MNVEIAEAVSLDERGVLTLEQLVELADLPAEELRALVDDGALAPVDPAATSWTFAASYVVVARTAGRLRRDFELDGHSLSVVLCYAQRVAALEAELRALRARMG
ncbi:MAG TPA: chaperone modulator CbpM [Casimicrobiaceae bacterium]